MLEEINEKLNKLLIDHQKKLDEIEFSFKEYEFIIESVNQILKRYNDSSSIDFDLLDTVISKLSNQGLEFENINYRELYEIRQDLLVNFSDRTEYIDSIFNDLMQKLNLYIMNQTREYAKFKRTIYSCKNEIERYNKIKKLIEHIQSGKIITQEEIQSLDEIYDFLDEYIEELYILIAKNNYYQMKKTIDIEREKARTKILDSRLKAEEPKPAPITRKTEDKPKITIELTEKEKNLVKIAQDIIAENDITDKSFLTMMEGLNPYEILSFVSEGNLKKNIALVLNDIILSDINSGKTKDIEKLLLSYISKYDICYKLSMLNKHDIISNIQNAEDIINDFNKLDKSQKVMYSGYVSNLSEHLSELKDIIYDDELFHSELFDSTYDSFLVTLDELKKIQLNQSINKNDEYHDAKDFYSDSYNFIYFPDNVNFSEIIDNDDTMQENHKRSILSGLKKLALDDNILTSSRHKVKDENIERYRHLRRFRQNDFRIVYMVSRAEGLEKTFGKKMNVVFALDAGYGARSDKSDFYNHSKKVYDISEDEINKAIKILNSNDADQINKLVGTQLSKLEDYIMKCNSNSIGIGGAKK